MLKSKNNNNQIRIVQMKITYWLLIKSSTKWLCKFCHENFKYTKADLSVQKKNKKTSF